MNVIGGFLGAFLVVLLFIGVSQMLWRRLSLFLIRHRFPTFLVRLFRSR